MVESSWFQQHRRITSQQISFEAKLLAYVKKNWRKVQDWSGITLEFQAGANSIYSSLVYAPTPTEPPYNYYLGQVDRLVIEGGEKGDYLHVTITTKTGLGKQHSYLDVSILLQLAGYIEHVEEQVRVQAAEDHRNGV